MTPYRQNIEYCFTHHIGEEGVSSEAFTSKLQQTKPILTLLANKQCPETTAIINSVNDRQAMLAIQDTARTIEEHFSTLVIIGMGGSITNPQTILALNENPPIKTIFIDTIDPLTITTLLDQLDWPHTAFLSISKSGKTLETLAQTLLFIENCKQRAMAPVGNHFFIITDNTTHNPLRQIATTIEATIIDHPAIGGRFSLYTNVALIAACATGLNIEAFLHGAQTTLQHAFHTENSLPAHAACISNLYIEKGKKITVLMPYTEKLSPFTVWFRQIWAESLGKESKGSTPIKAMGTLDQHSQLQLYLHGPRDKLYTTICLNTQNEGPVLHVPFKTEPAIDYLDGKTIGTINNISQQATTKTLIQNQRPVRTIAMDTLNEYSLGALTMHFMLETIITARLLNINAFNQPAVEQGKTLAIAMLQQQNNLSPSTEKAKKNSS